MELDQFTIEHEPVASIDLMERAAMQCTRWIVQHTEKNSFAIVTGQGNNGGDGLAIARQLAAEGKHVEVYICEIGQPSKDFSINLDRLVDITSVKQHRIVDAAIPRIPNHAVLIDAIFGYGLNRPVGPPWDSLIDHINGLDNEVIAIDLPSGLFADQPTTGVAIHADTTLTFETPKLSFFIPENHRIVGEWIVRPIDLDKKKYNALEATWETIDQPGIRALLHSRAKFDHKGTYGHAFLVVGSYGKVGAAILASQAALRSGAGLLTAHVPNKAYQIMQIAVPEAMVQVDRHDEHFSGVDHAPGYTAMGIGCGLGVHDCTVAGMRDLLKTLDKPVVLDADGLNVIAQHPEMIRDIPPMSIMTPHFKEFQRLFGPSANHFERLELAREMSIKHQLIIVLKGAHTAITMPSGKGYFNTTGNPGMATAGSGDVLTGILTGLLAQGYTPSESTLIGVYLHGLAGDIGVNSIGQEALVAGDLVQHLGAAFNAVRNKTDDTI